MANEMRRLLYEDPEYLAAADGVGDLRIMLAEDEGEWTLPADWEQCRLAIDAPRGTTLCLCDFE